MEYIHCFEYSLVALGLVAVCCHFMQVLKFLDNAFANPDSHGIPYTSKSFQLPDKVMIQVDVSSRLFPSCVPRRLLTA